MILPTPCVVLRTTLELVHIVTDFVLLSMHGEDGWCTMVEHFHGVVFHKRSFTAQAYTIRLIHLRAKPIQAALHLQNDIHSAPSFS